VWVGVSHLEAAAVLVCIPEKTQSGYVTEPPQAARPNRLTDAIGFCSAKAGNSREGAKARTGAASPALYSTRLRYLFSWRLLDVFTKRLHGCERRLAAIGGELKRIRAPVCRIMEEAKALVKKYFEVVAGFPPEVVAVAVLRTAAKAAGVPRPLEDFLKCSRADEHRVRRVAWRLKEVMKLGRRPSIEDYVKTLAARVNLPAPVVKAAVELLERNRRVLAGKNPWVWAAAALWLASFKMLGLLKALAEASGTTTASIRNAAKKMRV
jgi:hypothetical protein